MRELEVWLWISRAQKNSDENLCEKKTIFYSGSLTVQLINSVIFLQLWYYNNQKIAQCKHLFAQI